ncbi:hypothetical protein ACFY2M_10420 [Streptomyces sp. NPDC001276]|uniref:hypothetical protein n=1 Tax=Streptomyces sp. NPDC001276 TaxID=3364555 RepID=UPI0036AC81C9
MSASHKVSDSACEETGRTPQCTVAVIGRPGRRAAHMAAVKSRALTAETCGPPGATVHHTPVAP